VPTYQLHHEDDYITAEFKPKGANVAWNVNYINVFIPAWMVPPMYHSLRLEYIRVTDSKSAMGVKSLRPTWFEDEMVAKASADGSSNTLEPIAGGGAAPSPLHPTIRFF